MGVTAGGGITPAPPRADIALPWDRAARRPGGHAGRRPGPLRRHLRGRPGAGPSTCSCSPPSASGASTRCPRPRPARASPTGMMLRRKLPDELFDGRRTMPHELFGRDDVRTYLAELDARHRRRVRRAGRRRRGRRVRLHPPARPPHGPGVVGGRGAGPRRPLRRAWSTRSTSSTAPPRSCTRRPWPRWPRRPGGPSAPPWRRSRRCCTRRSERATRRHLQDDLFGRIVAHWDDVDEPGRPTGHRPRRDPRAPGLDVEPVRRGWAGCSATSLCTPTCSPGSGPARTGSSSGARSSRPASASARSCCGPSSTGDGRRRAPPPTRWPRAQIVTTSCRSPTRRRPRPRRLRPRPLGPPPAAGRGRLAARELVTTFGHGSTPARRSRSRSPPCAARPSRLLDHYDVAARRSPTAVPLPGQIGGVARSAAPCPVRYAVRA